MLLPFLMLSAFASNSADVGSHMVAGLPFNSVGVESRIGAPAPDDETLRIYDMRDLSSILPERRDGQNAASFVISSICRGMALSCEELSFGVFAVTTTPEKHELFSQQLVQLRTLYDGSFEVEIVCYPVDSAHLPSIGERAELAKDVMPFAQTRQVFSRRTLTKLESSREVRYVSDLQPVVADQAVGYDPEVSSAVSGLVLEVLVGAGPVSSEGVPLRLHGQLSTLSLKPTNFSVPGWQGMSMQQTLMLPEESSRSIDASLSVPSDHLAVVAVLDGFEPGMAVVVAARAKELAR